MGTSCPGSEEELVRAKEIVAGFIEKGIALGRDGFRRARYRQDQARVILSSCMAGKATSIWRVSRKRSILIVLLGLETFSAGRS